MLAVTRLAVVHDASTLTVDEVSAAMGVRVKPEEINEGPGHSICRWRTPDELDAFDLEVYWTGGKEAWRIEAMARGPSRWHATMFGT